MDTTSKVIAGIAGLVAVVGGYHYLTRPAQASEPPSNGISGNVLQVDFRSIQNQSALQQANAILAQGVHPLATSIPWQSTLRASVTWENLGAAGHRDVYLLYGEKNAAGDFVPAFDGISKGILIGSNQQVTTNIDKQIANAAMIGTWDCIVFVGYYDEPNNTFEPDDFLWVTDAVAIQGPTQVFGKIVNVTYSSV